MKMKWREGQRGWRGGKKGEGANEGNGRKGVEKTRWTGEGRK